MRNGTLQPQQQPQQQQLNESIQYARMLMQQFQQMQNPQTALMNLLQQNPQLKSILPMLHNGNSLENIAKQMAQTNNLDINKIISELQHL